jgi:uncharacterized protein Yka (UPF0111/DUF47 family)
MSWLQALMPKDDRFFELFATHSRTILAGATDLRALLNGGDQVPRHCKSILEHEAAADAITREVLQSVRRTFITPFDRGDIKDLITSMDDAIDEMQQTAKPSRCSSFAASSRRCAAWATPFWSAQLWCKTPFRCCGPSAPKPPGSALSASG